MIFAGCRWLTFLALVLVSGSLVARPSRANPPAAPKPGPAVKGFDTAVPAASVPGFGAAAQAEPPRDPAVRTAKDAKESPPKEQDETAIKDPKASPLPKSYRMRSPYERSSFPSGVPEWFKQRDADFDGQVFMSEYASVWTDEAARTFSRLDTNGDGVITARESVGRRDVKAEPPAGFSRLRQPNTAPSVPRAPVAEASTPPLAARRPPAEKTQTADLPPATTESAAAPAPHAIPQAFVAYADGVIKRFDADRDGVLTAEEWTAMPAAPTTADADSNGQITTNELAMWYVMKR